MTNVVITAAAAAAAASIAPASVPRAFVACGCICMTKRSICNTYGSAG
jgi:hypothetical protein